ncbi:hypothetical protein Pyrfu_1368 [Pyrolobus fumarii 1A]|uniref:Uncharacterized protein n=1 Tax=Pyrolobus fumarii (strain DSM 11204 / 1A) TaxID=694429 RepID=G0EGS8_PYRF1|nr:MgtC/SapB family protein [Pyrolobus fumarii]AEM39226.1 hypothetical protein Pyrfu_1368 [Pyrolobus fumarii 1A]
MNSGLDVAFPEFMARFAAALLAGSLVGLERERARVRSSKAKELPGLRSFGLLSAYGAVAGYLLDTMRGVWWYPLSLTAGFVLVVTVYTLYRLFTLKTGGVTTPIVMLLVYSLGFAAGLGLIVEAVAASAVTTLFLAIKTPVARLVKAVSYEELLAIFELALFYLALAPLVYSLDVEILGVKLSTIYTFFLLVLSVSFGGYLAWRVGASPVVYALLGGIVNSEAAVALIARQVRDPREIETLVPYVHLGMQYKTIALALAAAVLSHGLQLVERVAPLLALPLLVNTLLVFAWRPRSAPRLVSVSPLELGVALKTVVMYTGLLLAASILRPLLSRPETLVAYAILGGVVSATATVFALAAYLPPTPSLHLLAYAAVVAAATLNKPLYARMASIEAARRTLRTSLIFSAGFIILAAIAWLLPERI